MNTLILEPGKHSMKYALVTKDGSVAVRGKLESYRDGAEGYTNLSEIKAKLYEKSILQNRDLTPGCVAVRALYGGQFFDRAVAVTGVVIEKMKTMIKNAPLHMPAVVSLCENAPKVFENAQVAAVFDTAFFSNLPERETIYAIDNKLSKKLEISRTGYKGIFHEAAARQACAVLRENNVKNPAKVLSICLEPRPEAAAIIGDRPVMVTGGATPLEGMVGDASCGDMDSGILITIADELKWGYEMVNKMLTEESGLTALANRPVKLTDIFIDDKPVYAQIREILKYKILQVAGSALAAMGGMDTIVFSGRYREVAEKIGPWLVEKLSFIRRKKGEPKLCWQILKQSVEEAIAEDVAMLLIKEKSRSA